ncbi:putative homogentisate 1,2-dioxygenase [Bisporella sp. PMI_857]|nr:putative homogentisate 1,2-dioxygenase [Bisporella sp. PMI_857]
MLTLANLKFPIKYQDIFHWAETQKDGAVPSFGTRKNDPYEYQSGFNNTFASEAVPGTPPQGQNSPRNVRFGLYAEQMIASAFVAPRHLKKKAWLYRARPSADLPDNPDTESNFLPINSRVHISPTQLAWLPFEIPAGNDVDFVAGLKTIAGSGDPTLREGIATHIYVANSNMKNSAFGTLDIQTEFGMLFVQPGEIVVIQRGQKFKVAVPDGPSHGYILEIWGSNFELPELGPLGANGLANARDFFHPTAHYEIKQESWSVIYKLGGKFFQSTQQHSPLDVVAWHGNYVPYKYGLTKFVNVGSISVDHIDPSIFCVLTARSRDPAAPLADFLIFSPRWDAASHTYRPPYYHRNVASEFMGLLYGEYGGRSDDFLPGGASYECGMVPHGAIAFVFESSRPFTITDYAWNSNRKREHDPKMWDNLVDNFSKHEGEVKKLLALRLTKANRNGNQ